MKIAIGRDDRNIDSLDNIYSITDNGIHNIILPDVLKNKFNIVEDDTSYFLEVIATKSFCVQKIKTIKEEYTRYRSNGLWSEWESTIYRYKKTGEGGTLLDTNGYNEETLLEELQKYVNEVRGTDAIPIRQAKQPLYDDRPVRNKILRMVPVSREPEIVPSSKVQRDTLLIKNRDWMRIARLDTGDSAGIKVKESASYVIDNNYNNRYHFFRDETYTVIGDPKFERVYFEGHFRPSAYASRLSGVNITRRHDNLMVVSDLDWKWVYNGGRVGRVDIPHKPVSDIYYKCTPDLGYGWPQSGTTGTQTFANYGSCSINDSAHPVAFFDSDYVEGNNPNIEHVLWR